MARVSRWNGSALSGVVKSGHAESTLRGVLLFVLGVAGEAYPRAHDHMKNGTYSGRASFLSPIIITLGLALNIWALDKQADVAEFGPRGRPLREYPLGTKIFLGFGTLISIAQEAYLRRVIHF